MGALHKPKGVVEVVELSCSADGNLLVAVLDVWTLVILCRPRGTCSRDHIPIAPCRDQQPHRRFSVPPLLLMAFIAPAGIAAATPRPATAMRRSSLCAPPKFRRPRRSPVALAAAGSASTAMVVGGGALPDSAALLAGDKYGRKAVGGVAIIASEMVGSL